jgi:hypothetical protein
MLKQIRIAVLLYILLFVAVGSYLARARARAWDRPLWVDVYLVAAGPGAETHAYMDQVSADEFSGIGAFFTEQARAYGLGVDRPFHFDLVGPTDALPEAPANGALLGTIVWSLSMRWRVAELNWSSDAPSPDLVVFVVFHDPDSRTITERSTGLSKGLIAVAHVFADRRARGRNSMVIAHEMLHTVGATDKYDPRTNMPLYPIGYAEPERRPLYPQTKAEIRAGRMALDPGRARIPSIDEAVIGPATALEIGWDRKARQAD